MTKEAVKSDLAKLKLAVIMYHQTDENEFLRNGIARDDCYTAFNSLQYRQKELADTIADFETAEEEGNDRKADFLVRRAESLNDEIRETSERLDASKEVFEYLTGKAWVPPAKKVAAPVKNRKGRMAALKKQVEA